MTEEKHTPVLIRLLRPKSMKAGREIAGMPVDKRWYVKECKAYIEELKESGLRHIEAMENNETDYDYKKLLEFTTKEIEEYMEEIKKHE